MKWEVFTISIGVVMFLLGFLIGTRGASTNKPFELILKKGVPYEVVIKANQPEPIKSTISLTWVKKDEKPAWWSWIDENPIYHHAVHPLPEDEE